MTRTTEIQVFKKIASKNFSFKDFSFVSFIDIGKIEASDKIRDVLNGNIETEISSVDVLDIVARLALTYKGDFPKSYRVLNSMIMDWVDSNEKKIIDAIRPKIESYLRAEYPEVEFGDMDNAEELLWEEQVDYHPEVDADSGKVYFIVDLMLGIEEV